MRTTHPLLLVTAALAASCAAAPPRPAPPPPPAPVARPAAPPPIGPQPLTHEEFHRLLNAVDQEAGDKAKLAIVGTAAAHAWFSTAQAGALIDHLVYRESKLLVVPVLKSRILDVQNEYLLYQHFTYREDKAKVEEMLAH